MIEGERCILDSETFLAVCRSGCMCCKLCHDWIINIHIQSIMHTKAHILITLQNYSCNNISHRDNVHTPQVKQRRGQPLHETRLSLTSPRSSAMRADSEDCNTNRARPGVRCDPVKSNQIACFPFCTVRHTAPDSQRRESLPGQLEHLWLPRRSDVSPRP